MTETATFVTVAGEEDLWDGEMESHDVDGDEILLVRVDGRYFAYTGVCPHQSASLVEGELDGTVLTCSAHSWSFDVRTGEGVNPRTARLARHAVRIVDGQVEVSRRVITEDPQASEDTGADHGHH